MIPAKAVYRTLLHCYPAAFRDEYGGQMSLAFAEDLAEARRTGRLQQRRCGPAWRRMFCSLHPENIAT